MEENKAKTRAELAAEAQDLQRRTAEWRAKLTASLVTNLNANVNREVDQQKPTQERK